MKVFHYTDETDRSLGVAGMAISLVACDCEKMLAEVSVEEGAEPIRLSQEFFFSGNPRQSAKIAWNEMLRQYQVATGMLLANVLCRSRVSHKECDSELMQAIHELVSDLGHDECELDDDEINRLYSENLSYYTRLFSHRGVLTVASDFATVLRLRRTMSAGDVLEQLQRLNHI